MTIKDMHYDFKKKLNKIDSQQNRNLLIPEIDWTLNEAIELFRKFIANPRSKSNLGFEINQRSIDDIRTLVVNDAVITVTSNLATLPTDYVHYIKGWVSVDKSNCVNVKCKLKIRQHDDDFESNSFYNSSFEWRNVNGVFTQNTIKLYDDGTFTNKTLHLDYIKKHPYVHNAEDFRGGTYKLPSGTILTLTQDCILPEQTHREIVDIAVMIASGEINTSDYQIKEQKVNYNQQK